MIPQSKPKKPKNSSKANLAISLIFHAILIGCAFYFAARTGMLGEKIKSITVTKEEKPKDKPKEPEKPKEPPKEPPKVETPKPAVASKPTAPPPVAQMMAPPSSVAPTLDFSDGGKVVQTESDPVQLYKGYMEYILRQKWDRPENMTDDNYVAEVQVNVDKQGNISQPQWLKGSGDTKWDQTVKDVFKVVQNIDRRPPTNFPPNVIVRFDVQEETEPVMLQ